MQFAKRDILRAEKTGSVWTMQRPFGQFAAYEGAGDAGLTRIGPGEDFGLLVLGALQAAQRTCHGDDMHQAGALSELGVEHDGAGHMANRPVCGFFEDG